jgi:PAS domain S-box-containing protein
MILRNSLLAFGILFPLNYLLVWFFNGSSILDFSEKLILSILSFSIAYRIHSKTNNEPKEYFNIGLLFLFIISYYSIYKTYIYNYSIEYVFLSLFIFILCSISISSKFILFIYIILSFIGNFISSSLILPKEQMITINISSFLSFSFLYLILYNIITEKELLFIDQDFIKNTSFHSDSGILITDKFDKILFANSAACQLISGNFNPEFLMGTKIELPIQSKNKLLGIPTKIDLKENKHIEIQFTKVIWNQEICFLIQLKDLTLQYESELNSKYNNFILSQTLEYSKDGILNLNQDGIIIFANPNANKFLSTNKEELLGLHFQSLIKSSSFEAENEDFKMHPIQFTLSEGISYTISKEIFWRPNGSHFIAEYSISPILNESKIQGAVLIFRDISIKKEKEESEEKYKNELLHLTYSANKFLEILDENDLYTFIAYEMNIFFPNSSLIINLYDPLSNFFTTVSYSGFESKMNEIYLLLGRDFKGLKYTDETFEIENQKIISVSTLFELKYGNFNRKICSQIELITECKQVYSIPFFYKSIFLGNCILFFKEESFEITGTLEVFQNQVSVNLFKKVSMKQLFRDRLREESLIQSMSFLYTEISLEGYILYANPAFLHISGYSLQELLGKSIWSLLMPEATLEEVDSFRSKIQNHPILNFKLSFYTRGLGSIPITWDWVFRKNGDGDGEIISGIGRN